MACNHRELVRFDNERDGRYEVIRVLLRNIESKARLIVKRRLNASKRSVVDDATFSNLANSLNIVQFQRNRASVARASGNSKWILEEPKFLQWRDSNNESKDSNYLWVSGSEGLGKSKAALAAIESIEAMEKTQVSDEAELIVAYFFCDTTPDSQSAENLLKSLMWQLILKRRSLAQYVRGFAAQESSRSINTQSSFGFSKLWKGLQEMLRDPSSPRVYFIIANFHYLDTEDPSTNDFLNTIEGLMHDLDELEDPIKKNVKWMFLSRARENIQDALEGENHDGTVLRINLEDGSKDKQLRQMLKVYTQDRVGKLAVLKEYSLALQYFVTSILMKRAENNKLWVEVVCRLLEGLPSNHVLVRKTLEALPQDVQILMSKVWKEVSVPSSTLMSELLQF